MSARFALNNKLTTVAVLLLLAAEVPWGCASARISPGDLHRAHPLRTVSLGDQGMSLAVWLEDQCESEARDRKTVTLLEALHDGIVVPAGMLFAVAVVATAGTVWSLYDRFMLPAGEPFPNRPQMILEYVKPFQAGPKLDSKRYGQNIPFAWLGCLEFYGDGFQPLSDGPSGGFLTYQER